MMGDGVIKEQVPDHIRICLTVVCASTEYVGNHHTNSYLAAPIVNSGILFGTSCRIAVRVEADGLAGQSC